MNAVLYGVAVALFAYATCIFVVLARWHVRENRRRARREQRRIRNRERSDRDRRRLRLRVT